MTHTEPDDGGSAFPYPAQGGRMAGGMSLRDYFAGQALTGLFNISNRMPDETIARQCYGVADAMIAVRNFLPEQPKEVAP